MRILAVELHDFRNLGAAFVEPHERFTVLSGDNGQGKTNFLEAIFLVGALRSFRASRLEELVHFGATSARARAKVSRAGLERLYEVEVVSQPPRKVARVDGKAVRGAADYFGGYNVVLFSADDLRLPRGSPAGRRRFLDRAVWNAEPAFLHSAQAYEKTLRSRNALLREGAPRSQLEDLLAVYDEQLALAGADLVARRRRYLRTLAPRVAAAYERITRSGLALEIGYESALDAPDLELASQLRALLTERRRRDLLAGYSTAGPHTDDVALQLDGRPARLYASQGQLRALVLALKVAEIQHLLDVLSDAPILLLDDVSSELDPARNAFLFEFLREVVCQVFITTTHPANVHLSADRLDLRVQSGTIVVDRTSRRDLAAPSASPPAVVEPDKNKP